MHLFSRVRPTLQCSANEGASCASTELRADPRVEVTTSVLCGGQTRKQRRKLDRLAALSNATTTTSTSVLGGSGYICRASRMQSTAHGPLRLERVPPSSLTSSLLDHKSGATPAPWTMTSWNVKMANAVPLSQFCQKCGAILPIVDHKDGDILRCQICNHRASEFDYVCLR